MRLSRSTGQSGPSRSSGRPSASSPSRPSRLRLTTVLALALPLATTATTLTSGSAAAAPAHPAHPAPAMPGAPAGRPHAGRPDPVGFTLAKSMDGLTGRRVDANHLTVGVDDGYGTVTTFDLRCDPPGPSVRGDDHPDPVEACARMRRTGGPVAPTPEGQKCSMIFGGPQTARVTGVWNGTPVDEQYSRVNGCEVGRWNRMAPLLPTRRTGS